MAKIFNKKKILVGLITASLASTGIGSAVYAQNIGFLFGDDEKNTAIPPQVVSVERKTIENTINVTGALASASEVSAVVDADAAELKVKDIRVKVGDVVSEGDVLFTLDTSEIEKTLANTEQKLAILERKNEITAIQEKRDYEDLKKNNAILERQEVRTILNTEDHLDDQYVDRDLALDDLYLKYGVEDQTYFDTCEAQKEMFQAEDDLNAARADASVSNAELNVLIKAYNDAVAKFNTALTTYETAITASIASEATVRGHNRTIRDTEKDLIDKEETLEKSNRERSSSEKKSKETNEMNALDRSISDFDLTLSLEKLRKQITASTITAKTSGVVTAVNAKVGISAGTDPVVVTNINNYNVACDVDEQYIADIQQDMQAHFTTNATGDEFLNGTVTFVAVTPTKQQSNNNNTEAGGNTSTSGQTDKTRGNYRVIIKVNDQNERLRPGMTAKISIIKESVEDVIAVPNEAIDYDMDGNEIVHITKDDGATSEDVPITVGITDGSYTQITSEGLAEGTQLLVPQEEADAALDGELY